MARFKKILSFLKGSKKRKSVVIHDSRSIRNSEIPIGGLAGNGNVRFGTNTGRPRVGNGGHYEQFLYVDDVKNGGLKKRTLSVAPSVVSSSNYTQTDNELSDTLSHLRSESSRFERFINNKMNGMSMTSRMNSIGSAGINKTSNIHNNTKKNNKSFTIRQDPIEEEKVIVEVQDNNEEEIEIDEDELIAAIEEFDNERKGTSKSSTHTDTSTFIIKEDKEDQEGNQSFIIKNINDDVHTKKLSFIISSANQQSYNADENDEENINSSESYLLSTPNITYSSQEKSNNEVNIEIEGMENPKKDYLMNTKTNMMANTNVKESMIQFQPPEFSITNEKVYNYHNNDLIKTIFKKIPHEEKEKVDDEIDDENEALGSNQTKRKVNFIINNKNSNGKFSNNGSLTKKLSVKSAETPYIHTPKPILITSPTLTKSNIATSTDKKTTKTTKTTKTKNTDESIGRTLSLNHKLSNKHIDSMDVPRTKTSNDSITLQSNNKREITEMNENLKQSSSAYTSAVPSSSTRNIFFMPLPRPSQATLLDFGNSPKNSPVLTTKRSNLYSHTNLSIGNFPLSTDNSSVETTSSVKRYPWNENITSPVKAKEGNLYSAPLKPSVPISTTYKSLLEKPIGTFMSSNNKLGSHKLTSNPSSNTLFSQTTLYSSNKSSSKSKKEKTIPNSAKASSTPYIINKGDTNSFTESSSNQSYISDIPKEEFSKDKQYIFSPNIPIGHADVDYYPENDDSISNPELSLRLDDYNGKSDKSREESLRHVKEFVKSLDENPDTDSIFSAPLAYRKRYEKYGSMRSRTSRTSNRSRQTRANPSSGNTSFSTISGSLKSNRKLNSKRSNISDATEASSMTEFSETTSSYSVQTSSTNRTAPTQNSIYSRDYYNSSTNKYIKNKPLPIPSNQQKLKTSLDENIYGESLNSLKKEKFYSDSTMVNSFNKKYNNKSTSLTKHKNSPSISSGSTLAYSPLPGPRSLLNNNNNLNKLSLMAADNDYFDDFMKDLNNMSLNDLISKYETKN